MGRLRALVLCSAMSVGVALVAGEVFLRLAREPIDLERLRASSLAYERVAFARHAFPRRTQRVRATDSERTAVQIGPRGYRGRDFAVPKPAGTRRVVVLGGSAAFDPHAEPDRDWPRRVEARLRRRGLHAVEVINAGIPGHASADSLGRLFSEIWMFEPDWVLVYHCWNDLKYFSWLGPDRSLLHGVRAPLARSGDRRVWNPFVHASGPVDRLLASSQLYLRARRRYWEWKLGLIGPEGLIALDSERERRRRRGEGLPESFESWGPRQLELTLELIVSASRRIGAEPLLMTQARLLAADNTQEDVARMNLAYLGLSHQGALEAFRACDDTIRKVATTEDVPWLDASAGISGHARLFQDHVHLSEAGSERLARRVADDLAGRLETSRRVTRRPADEASSPPARPPAGPRARPIRRPPERARGASPRPRMLRGPPACASGSPPPA